ncbi:MAG: right-handed parallel beta-helix repeat-containing protein, partial [Steroidobacteraceae bacterium]
IDSRNLLAFGALALMGTLALLEHWVADRRPAPAAVRAAHESVVVNGGDRGAGSLREAVFAADSAAGRARIVLRTARIALRSPLPPIVNPHGVVIEAEQQGTEIDARELDNGPVFDIDANSSSINGLVIRNAREQAILVRAGNFQLTATTIEDCDEGVYVAEGIRGVLIEDSQFANNRIGIRLASASPDIVVRHNRFAGHRDAALWIVRSEFDRRDARPMLVRENHFRDDRISVVLGNAAVAVESNEFERARDAALYLIGEGAIVRANRIRNGPTTGIVAQAAHGAAIESNELDHLSALAILVRDSRNTLVRGNRLHNNGYGIAFVLGEAGRPSVAHDNTLMSQRYDGIIVIGDSPVLRHNRVLASRSAALRVLDFLPLVGRRVTARPFLQDNVWDGNRFNEVVRGVYRQEKTEAAR